ncbi:Peptide-N(4)-(N-acetyl-beta- glucosaminyl)asparagine amidase [Desmophyllum pertusum]|uniref:Thioredoxin n=1 Tax=Desmophyllum pertusum TaxID=174260 RepID=A0A9W9ZS65_9CNID|nr:Peptide-N(4)-(N-acetyl-beta- glucosaminyl)asparagine amidase [Desmophyllum pertusum]
MRELKSLKKLNELLESSGNKLVVIDFYADWCGPCRIMAPKFEQLDSEFLDVIFAKVNIEKSSKDISNQYAISSIPHFKFFKYKTEVDNVKGANETSLKEKIEKWH